jgi:hypothetical protein
MTCSIARRPAGLRALCQLRRDCKLDVINSESLFNEQKFYMYFTFLDIGRCRQAEGSPTRVTQPSLTKNLWGNEGWIKQQPITN